MLYSFDGLYLCVSTGWGMKKREREKRRCNKQEFSPLLDIGSSIPSCAGRVLSGKFERDV